MQKTPGSENRWTKEENRIINKINLKKNKILDLGRSSVYEELVTFSHDLSASPGESVLPEYNSHDMIAGICRKQNRQKYIKKKIFSMTRIRRR